jgi:DNA-directed RNA polymerase subunit L
MACSIIIGKLDGLSKEIMNIPLADSGGKNLLIELKKSSEVFNFPSLMENSYDVILHNEDYTIGCVLQDIILNKYYVKENSESGGDIKYCGFKKFHPHDKFSVLRIAFKKSENIDILINLINNSCLDGIKTFEIIRKYFEKSNL